MRTRREALAQRMLGHVGAQLANELAVASEREIGVDPQLDRRQPDLLEPGDGPWAKLSYARSASAGPLHSDSASRRRWEASAARSSSEQAPRLVDQPLEAVEIERLGLDPGAYPGERVISRVLGSALRSRETFTRSGGAVLRRVLAPQLVDQPVGGNDLVGMQEEHREQRPRFATAEGELDAFVPHLERSEDRNSM